MMKYIIKNVVKYKINIMKLNESKMIIWSYWRFDVTILYIFMLTTFVKTLSDNDLHRRGSKYHFQLKKLLTNNESLYSILSET